MIIWQLSKLILLFTILICADTYTVVYVQNWKNVLLILAPINCLLCVPFWYVWKELYVLIGMNIWQVSIISAIPISLGCWIGTFLGSGGQTPTKYQVFAILINGIAVIVSKQ